MFYVGQRVIVDCRDADYMQARVLENGMVGEVLGIDRRRRFPVKVNVERHIGPAECLFRFDELKPAQNTAKII